MTNEHLFSEWIRKAMPPVSGANRSTLERIGHPALTRQWESNQPVTFQVKCVCSKCNETWMGNIDRAAKPILLEMMEGRATRLTPADRETVAQWAVLKTMVSEFVEGFEHAIPKADLAAFYENRTIPARCRVYIGKYDGSRNCFFQHLLIRSPLPANCTGNPHCTTISIRSVVLEVVGLSFFEDGQAGHESAQLGNIVRLIYPSKKASILWPPIFTMGDMELDRIGVTRLKLEGILP